MPFGQLWRARGNPFAQSRDKLNVALGGLLDATSAAGVTRREVSAVDLLMTLSGIAMAAGAPYQRAQMQRMIDLVFEGLRSR